MAQGSKTGGRQKGTPNRSTAIKSAEIEASGLTPFDYLLSVVRDESADTKERTDAAKAILPYCNARLAPTQPKEVGHRHVVFLPRPLTEEEWVEKMVEINGPEARNVIEVAD